MRTTDIPEFIDLFDIDAQKYPLLLEVKDYILSVRLDAGDCLYMPQFWWVAFASRNDVSIFLQFTYESSSKLTELLFEAIQEGLMSESF